MSKSKYPKLARLPQSIDQLQRYLAVQIEELMIKPLVAKGMAMEDAMINAEIMADTFKTAMGVYHKLMRAGKVPKHMQYKEAPDDDATSR